MEMAEAELRGAENELAGARDSAVRDVWKAYTDFKTALRKQDSAAKLVTASQNAFDAVLESYKNGPQHLSGDRQRAAKPGLPRGVWVTTRSPPFLPPQPRLH